MSGACSTERACNTEKWRSTQRQTQTLELRNDSAPELPSTVGATKHQRNRREFYQSQSHFNAEARERNGRAAMRLEEPDDLMQLNLRTAHLPRRGAVPAIQFGL
jgi:hypothetical protein